MMEVGVQLRANFGDDVIARLETLRRADVPLAEIDGRDVIDRAKDVENYMRSTGMRVSTVCGGYLGWIGHFERDLRERAIADIQEILTKSRDVNAPGIVVPAAYGMFSTRLNAKVAPRSAAEDRAILLDSLGRLNEHAQATDTFVYLEPLNRYEDHMLNTLDQAADLIKEGKFQRVRLVADTFHMNIEEPSVEQSVERWRHLLGHVHLADSNRLQPGQGHFDFHRFLRTLSRVQYAGSVIMECSWQGELTTSLRTSMDFITRSMEP